MDDPTNILQQQIAKAAEESKIIDQKQDNGNKKGFMSMAAESNETGAAADDDDDVTTAELIHQSLPMAKHKSYTPMPQRRSHAKSGHDGHGQKVSGRRPFILGICGGPSSGMSTVAKNIKTELQKSNISTAVVSLANFYRPIRGNLRKNRSRAGSLVEEENKEEVLKEIQEINETVDFDDPKQIDFELLIVSASVKFLSVSNLFDFV